MPFSGPSDSSLPSNIKRLSSSRRSQWVKVWNSSHSRCLSQGRPDCESVAFRTANGVISRESSVPVVKVGGNVTLLESFSADGAGLARVLAAGPNLNETFLYPESTLRRDASVFSNATVYIDHPTDAEDTQRPERSFRDKVGVLGAARWNAESSSIEAPLQIFDPSLREKLSLMKASGNLSEAQLSIRALGRAKKGELRKGKPINIVQSLTKALSVDIVTTANAGGELLLYESRRAKETVTMTDEEKEQVVAEAQAESKKEMDTLREEFAEMKKRDEESSRKLKLSETAATVRKKLEDVDLPEPAKKQIQAQFSESESSEGLDEAIKSMELLVGSIHENVASKLKKKVVPAREAKTEKRGMESEKDDKTETRESLRDRTYRRYFREFDNKDKAERATEQAMMGRSY